MDHASRVSLTELCRSAKDACLCPRRTAGPLFDGHLIIELVQPLILRAPHWVHGTPNTGPTNSFATTVTTTATGRASTTTTPRTDVVHQIWHPHRGPRYSRRTTNSLRPTSFTRAASEGRQRWCGLHHWVIPAHCTDGRSPVVQCAHRTGPFIRSEAIRGNVVRRPESNTVSCSRPSRGRIAHTANNVASHVPSSHVPGTVGSPFLTVVASQLAVRVHPSGARRGNQRHRWSDHASRPLWMQHIMHYIVPRMLARFTVPGLCPIQQRALGALPGQAPPSHCAA
jgi:hypothetical protein